MNQGNRPPQGTPPMIHLGGPRRGMGGPGGPMAARLNAEKPKHTKKTVLRLLRYIGKSGFLLLFLLWNSF